MVFDNATITFAQDTYRYVEDPTIVDFDRQTSIISGGMLVNVLGTNLDSVQYPQMYLNHRGMEFIGVSRKFCGTQPGIYNWFLCTLCSLFHTFSSFFVRISACNQDNVTRTFIHQVVRRLTARSREDSKPWDSGLDFSNRSAIWQAPSVAVEMPVKLQSNTAILIPNPVASRLHEIWRDYVLPFSE